MEKWNNCCVECVELKPKMCSFLVDNSELKKGKDVNKSVVAAISHNEYKDVLLNNKMYKTLDE